MVDLQTLSLLVQMVGVSATAAAAVVGVRSYINSNKRAEESRHRELETRQAQLFMEIYQHFYSRELSEHEFYLDHIEVKNIEVYKKLMDDRDFWNAFGTFHGYYEGIGILVKEGLVDIRLVAQLMSGPVRWFWERYESLVYEARKEYGWPRMMIEVEYLYNALNEYAASHPELQVASPKY